MIISMVCQTSRFFRACTIILMVWHVNNRWHHTPKVVKAIDSYVYHSLHPVQKVTAYQIAPIWRIRLIAQTLNLTVSFGVWFKHVIYFSIEYVKFVLRYSRTVVPISRNGNSKCWVLEHSLVITMSILNLMDSINEWNFYFMTWILLLLLHRLGFSLVYEGNEWLLIFADQVGYDKE